MNNDVIARRTVHGAEFVTIEYKNGIRDRQQDLEEER
jgi:hypothetical protein